MMQLYGINNPFNFPENYHCYFLVGGIVLYCMTLNLPIIYIASAIVGPASACLAHQYHCNIYHFLFNDSLPLVQRGVESICGYDLLTGLVLAAVGIILGGLGLTSLQKRFYTIYYK